MRGSSPQIFEQTPAPSRHGVILALVIGSVTWLCPLLTPPTAAAVEYHVAPTGLDTNDGLSAESPFQTIGRGAEVARHGDMILIHEGIYSEFLVFPHSGTVDAPIHIQPYLTDLAVIDGSALSPDFDAPWNRPPLVRVSGNYVTISGLEVRHAPGDGIFVTGQHVVLFNLHVHHTYLSGVQFFSTWDGTLSNSNIHDAHDYGSGGRNADCVSMGWYNDHGRHKVRNNAVYNCADDGIDAWTAYDNLIEGNIVHHAGFSAEGNGSGFKLGSSAYPFGGRNIVRNNVAYDNKGWGFGSNEGPDNLVYNNTAFRNGYGNFANWGKPGIYRNNLSVDGGDNLALMSGGHNSWNLGIHDPLFKSIDPTSPDFLRLQEESPAVDAGAAVGLPFKGRASDLGAYESDGSSSLPPSVNLCRVLIPLDLSAAWSDGGFAWGLPVSLGVPADATLASSTSTIRVFENNTELGPPHALHADIRSLGHGRFSHYSLPDGTEETLRLSATDNSDPRTNGRTYAYCTPDSGLKTPRRRTISR